LIPRLGVLAALALQAACRDVPVTAPGPLRVGGPARDLGDDAPGVFSCPTSEPQPNGFTIYNYSGIYGVFCYYAYPGKVYSDEGDWSVQGGYVVLRSLAYKRGSSWNGFLLGMRFDGSGATFQRETPPSSGDTCDAGGTQIVYDPNNPLPDCSGGGGSGSGADPTGGAGGCTTVSVTIEIDYGDGRGYQTVYEGYATVCE
jgi:hypothetical protein